MMQDPIADMIARIKNASMVGTQKVSLPYSKVKFAIAMILEKEGYITSVAQSGEGKEKLLTLQLKYSKKFPALSDIKRLSKPGLRVYVRSYQLPKVQGGRGTVILSTPKGLMTGKEAFRQNLGGELICKVW